MHRHGYKGRKLSRTTGQRKALVRGLAISLVDHGSIETTLPKAKEVVPYVEKLVTKAKQNTLHSKRQVISKLRDLTTVDILYDEILPAVENRSSGYLRIEKTRNRLGDGAPLARVSFVDDLTKTIAKKPAKPVADKSKKPEEVKAEVNNEK